MRKGARTRRLISQEESGPCEGRTGPVIVWILPWRPGVRRSCALRLVVRGTCRRACPVEPSESRVVRGFQVASSWRPASTADTSRRDHIRPVFPEASDSMEADPVSQPRTSNSAVASPIFGVLGGIPAGDGSGGRPLRGRRDSQDEAIPWFTGRGMAIAGLVLGVTRPRLLDARPGGHRDRGHRRRPVGRPRSRPSPSDSPGT